jgi:hypothetical protein
VKIINDIKSVNKIDYKNTLKKYSDLLISLTEVDGIYTYGGKNINPGISDLDILITVNSKVSENFLSVYNKWREIGDYAGYIIKHPPLVCSNKSIKKVVLGFGFNLNTIYGKNYDSLRDDVIKEHGEIWLETLYWDYLSFMFNQLISYIKSNREISKREFLYLIGSISHSLKYAISRENDSDINEVINTIDLYRFNYNSLNYDDITEFSIKLFNSLWKSSFIIANSSLVFDKKIVKTYKKYYHFSGINILVFKPYTISNTEISKVSKLKFVDMPLPLFIYNESIYGFNFKNFGTTIYKLVFKSFINKDAYSYLEIRNNNAKVVKREVHELDLPFATIIPLGYRAIYKKTTKSLISKNAYLFNNYIFPTINGLTNYLKKLIFTL